MVGGIVRAAIQGDQNQIDTLIEKGYLVHRHLDWRRPQEWLNSDPFLVFEMNGKIEAIMACPSEPPGIAWMRVFASRDWMHVEAAWQRLWSGTTQYFESHAGGKVVVISMQMWLHELLRKSGFHIRQEILMLNRSLLNLPKSETHPDVTIRKMEYSDLPQAAETDAAAFNLLWQNSLETLRRALPQASLATVAIFKGRVIGYQISTSNPVGGHLARLAVLPEWQGQGIASMLVANLLGFMAGQGAQMITVNTQSDNQVSRLLYKKLGFIETGEKFPVFEFDIQPIKH